MVSCGFPFVFIRCFGCSATGTWTEFAYYLPFIAVLQVGWACAQISHLALIGQLTDVQSERTELVGYRYVTDCRLQSLFIAINKTVPMAHTICGQCSARFLPVLESFCIFVSDFRGLESPWKKTDKVLDSAWICAKTPLTLSVSQFFWLWQNESTKAFSAILV